MMIGGRPPLVIMVPALPHQPTTGGEAYNQRLVRGLSATWDVRPCTLDDLGLGTAAGAGALAAAMARWTAQLGKPAPVIQDTWFYERAAGLNRTLGRCGFRPIIGFGQALYPARYRSRVAHLRHQLLLGRYLRTCDAHIVVSAAMQQAYRRLGVAVRRVVIVYPGFDLVAQSVPGARTPRADGRLRVVGAGSYTPAKGQDVIVDAVGRLLNQRPDLRARLQVDLYGRQDHNPGFFAALVRQVEALGPDHVVRLHGMVPQADLWRTLAESDIFLFPARGEGLGMAVLEAMLCGCVPVVSPDRPLLEVLGEGRGRYAGLVVAPSARAFASALAMLADDPQRRSDLARRATRRAREIARDWDTTIAAFDAAVGHWARMAVA